MTKLQKWADAHQYHAEPQPTATDHDGVQPKVFLIGMTNDPLGQMAAFANIYRGKVNRDLSSITDDERRQALSDMQVTELQQPMEVVKMHFLIEGVDRAFTHQHVRQRMAGYGQESMRFAVLGELLDATTIPPSLQGTERSDLASPLMPTGQIEQNRRVWDETIKAIDDAYHYLVNNGMAVEEARGLLPHCTATRIHYDVDLRNFAEMAGKRLCTQAQFSWRKVFIMMVDSIRNYTPDFSWCPKTLAEPMAERWEAEYRWQFEAIADSGLFRPVCYKTGKCEMTAATDRTCSIRSRVSAFAAHGVPSSKWGADQGDSGFVKIHDSEWLDDPAAARMVGQA